MHATMGRWTEQSGWCFEGGQPPAVADWILYFGATARLEQGAPAVAALRSRYPKAVCSGCSTAGEIYQNGVSDDAVCAALVTFEETRVCGCAVDVATPDASRTAARELTARLAAPDLRHVLVLSDGLQVNGTLLAAGLREGLPEAVTVTGGLAGDGTRFGRTVVGLGDQVRGGMVVAVGLYGTRLRVGCCSAGGWESFGPRRRITRARGSVLYELDGQPALDLYKRYLGDRAADLPASGLLFPLELLARSGDERGLVRTILAVDEAQHSLTFAGDMPEDSFVRLMRTRHDGLLLGAEQAARGAGLASGNGRPEFTVLVSCVGRRLVLGARADEEVEAVTRALAGGGPALGFYSYGEICPPAGLRACELHNQTMTVTTFAETGPTA